MSCLSRLRQFTPFLSLSCSLLCLFSTGTSWTEVSPGPWPPQTSAAFPAHAQRGGWPFRGALPLLRGGPGWVGGIRVSGQGQPDPSISPFPIPYLLGFPRGPFPSPLAHLASHRHSLVPIPLSVSSTQHETWHRDDEQKEQVRGTMQLPCPTYTPLHFPDSSEGGGPSTAAQWRTRARRSFLTTFTLRAMNGLLQFSD